MDNRILLLVFLIKIIGIRIKIYFRNVLGLVFCFKVSNRFLVMFIGEKVRVELGIK